MNKTDIVRKIYENSDKKIPMKDLDLIVEKTFDLISEVIQQGKEVQISGFGSFSLPEKVTKPLIKIRKVVNPKK
ncbi:HU family DNA-binding protein [Polynucleobacter sp. Tro8-14-1]|uniref:HU family DNA-binding protein n=1 Tax=Polynucleobacter sp. Tro8-14-1 TaxID=1758383 RepID=UPI001C0DBBD9|nr:HU family DNA-binding protein [Polynucleobacter sp. Tro8-14-1]MBU3563649.1 HU family DNA-binding protein [Polynucleobacter sp. Tro8-14-1]